MAEQDGQTAQTDGGPAFPRYEYSQHYSDGHKFQPVIDHEPGMSLRDYFAAKAMQSLAIAFHTDQDTARFIEGLAVTMKCRQIDAIAARAVAQADSLIAALAQPPRITSMGVEQAEAAAKAGE